MPNVDLDTITLAKGNHPDRSNGLCIEWPGRRDENGYGRAGHRGRAHRRAWEDANGPIPDGLHVLHHCDNPPCVNPAHLFLGTRADNNADRHAKGRTVMPTNGPDFWRAKTHCPQGHPYSGDNVRYRSNGARRCAQCYRDRAQSYFTEHRAEVNARKRARRAAQKVGA